MLRGDEDQAQRIGEERNLASCASDLGSCITESREKKNPVQNIGNNFDIVPQWRE